MESYKSRHDFAHRQTKSFVADIWNKYESPPLSIAATSTYPFWFSLFYAVSFKVLEKGNDAYRLRFT